MREDYFRKILDSLPVGIAIHTAGPETSFEYFNDHFLKFYRITREALTVPEAFWENAFEDPVFREQIKARILEDYMSGDPERMSWDYIPISRSDGETTYINAKSIPVPGNDRVISLVWDVTRFIKTSEQLRKNKIKMGDTMDLAKLANWEYDVESDNFSFDDRFYALYGTTKERGGHHDRRTVRGEVHPDGRAVRRAGRGGESH
ncbi:PAS domain-containing protein [Methanolacinia petrolearia]|uniref:PAS domain-containing protein n=1 Tax=Methanolacinia petrolearia TaxID=54120 RepID=UPI003BA98653